MDEYGKSATVPRMEDCETILLTGLPRGGTTLTCVLLNKLEGVVALDEPLDIKRVFASSDTVEIAGHIRRFAAQTATSVRQSGTARSKQIDGKIVDNHATTRSSETGLYKFAGSLGDVTVTGVDDGPFKLFIKHPFQFTAMLEQLAPQFPMFAIIRNPISVLGSWNRVDFPIRQGKGVSGEILAPELHAKLANEPDRHARQIEILDWYFERYDRHLPATRIVRYEDVIASKGKALKVLHASACDLDEPLHSKNANSEYDRDLLEKLAPKLVERGGAFLKYYTAADIDSVLETASSGAF